jgi:hypothetical protein
MTLDNWGATMLSVSDSNLCGTSPQGTEACGTPLCAFYFFPFVMISGYVTVNLFCATILDNFETTMEIDKSALKMNDLKKFVDAWSFFDPEASMHLATLKLPLLLAAVKPPLGIARAKDRLALLRLTRSYVIPEHGGVIHFVETLIPLARRVMGVEFSDRDILSHEEAWKSEFQDLSALPVLMFRRNRITVDHYMAATYIAAAHRRRAASITAMQLAKEKTERLNAEYDELGVPMEDRLEVQRLERFMLRREQTRKNLLEVRNSKKTFPSRRSMSVVKVHSSARLK